MYTRDFDKLSKRLKSDSRKLKEALDKANLYPDFTYDELELIYRVFKSVIKDIEGKSDFRNAKSIIEKTERFE